MPYTDPKTWVLTVIAVAFLALGVRAFLQPRPVASLFGIPQLSDDGLAFVRVYGARTIGIAVLALFFIAAGFLASLSALLFVGGGLAALDFLIVRRESGPKRAAKHLAYMTVLPLLGLWVLAPLIWQAP
jgi:hypothetical protein